MLGLLEQPQTPCQSCFTLLKFFPKPDVEAQLFCVKANTFQSYSPVPKNLVNLFIIQWVGAHRGMPF
jgi:hypothetical protein